jgi:hypothetical protein
MKMTAAIARAAGWDAANRQMRKRGDTKWNEDDWNLAAKIFNELYPMETE